MNASAPLQAALQSVEPGVRIVPERRLRRALHAMRTRELPVADNPELPLWVGRETFAESGHIGEETGTAGSTKLLLLSAPEDRSPAPKSELETLYVYWRLLYQAAIHERVERAGLTAGECRSRLAALGGRAEREVRHVLEDESRLDPTADAAAELAAFAATYLDFLHFAPEALGDFFPSLPGGEIVARAFPEGLDDAGLVLSTRPPGAPDRNFRFPSACPVGDTECESSPASDSHGAEAAARRGNHVRSAILYWRSPTGRGPAQEEIGKLVNRLGAVCKWTEAECKRWGEAIVPLLGSAAGGGWPRAARCLFDLQKIPADLRGDTRTVDLVEWARSLGRRPLVRPLPLTHDLSLIRHFRSAEGQLTRSPVSEGDRRPLSDLLKDQIRRLEVKVRSDLTPIVVAAFDAVGLRPDSAAEVVGREKLVAELLDLVCDRGYLRISDLRDAVARNRLKLPDLAGPMELVRGDPILRADTRLTYDLDGIYRRGEVYLRLLQRFSSLSFGTPWGRLLTLYVAIPVGGAFLALAFAEEVRHVGGKLGEFASGLLASRPKAQASTVQEPTATGGFWDDDSETWIGWDRAKAGDLTREVLTSSEPAAHGGTSLVEFPAVIGVGLIFLAALHVPPFRRALLAALHFLGRVFRLLLFDGPRAFWHCRPVRFVRDNAVSRFVAFYLGVPIGLTAAFALALGAMGASPVRTIRWGFVFFTLVGVLANTALGWAVRDRVAGRVSSGWRTLTSDVVPGLIGATLQLFQMLAGWIERRSYAVDEWLRFREGDSRGSLACKALLGLIWFPFAYVARFAFYLLIEPQVNPIKHFPVVTVSHKVILPMSPRIAAATGLPKWEVGLAVTGAPGIFGFMAWELKENWRLYRANRPDDLCPATVGSHGESMRRLLRPAFHSGTLPKDFRRLRRAWQLNRSDRVARGHRDLEHVAEAVHRLVDRELIAQLRTQPEWSETPLAVTSVKCGCLCATATLAVGASAAPARIGFENRGGRIEGYIAEAAALDDLNERQRSSFRDAVAGLFDLGSAERFDGIEREFDAPSPTGYLRRWHWREWVRRWGKVAEGNA